MKTIAELKKEAHLPVVTVDEFGVITFINEAFTNFFGWSQKEIIGRPLTIIIPKNLHDAHHLGFSRFLSTEAPTLMNQPLKLKALLKNGKEIDAEHIIIAEKINGFWVFGATLRPLP